MKGPAAVAYKCRLCGEVYFPVHVADGHLVARHLLAGEMLPGSPSSRPPRATEHHRCSGRVLGVADFVGVQFDAPADEAPDVPADASPAGEDPGHAASPPAPP